MKPIPSEFERSIHRSRHRLLVLLTLSSLGEAYVNQLSRHTGIRPSRVRAVLVGKPPSYRVERSLVHLGLAREVGRGEGRAFEITSKGRRKARSFASAFAPRAGGGFGVRHWLRAGAPVVPHRAERLSPGGPTPGPSPAPGPSFTWSVAP